jgi:hypothetical protein
MSVLKRRTRDYNSQPGGPLKPQPDDDPVRGPHGPGDGPDNL